MLTEGDTSSYEHSEGLYNWTVRHFTIGDVIRKARVAGRLSQTQLGDAAALFQIDDGAAPINKSTVSKVERDPFTSELGTVWRLLAALHLTFGDVEKQIGSPVVERRKVSPRRSGTG